MKLLGMPLAPAAAGSQSMASSTQRPATAQVDGAAAGEELAATRAGPPKEKPSPASFFFAKRARTQAQATAPVLPVLATAAASAAATVVLNADSNAG